MATAIPYAEFIGDGDRLATMESTPKFIAEIRAELSDEQLARTPQPGKWSIHQIVAHLADCEIMFQGRLRMILFQDNPTLVSFDQETWSAGWAREKEPFDVTFERFRVLRESTLRLLRNTPEADLQRIGTHTERGPQKAVDYITLIAGHDINHRRQIQALRTSANT